MQRERERAVGVLAGVRERGGAGERAPGKSTLVEQLDASSWEPGVEAEAHGDVGQGVGHVAQVAAPPTGVLGGGGPAPRPRQEGGQPRLQLGSSAGGAATAPEREANTFFTVDLSGLRSADREYLFQLIKPRAEELVRSLEQAEQILTKFRRDFDRSRLGDRLK